MKNPQYALKEEDGVYKILINGKKELITPHKTVFSTPYKTVAEAMIDDLKYKGYDSYTSGLSSLCHAFTLDNLRTQDLVESTRKNLSEAPYEEDFWFQPDGGGMPYARVIWNHVMYDENRAEDVHNWVSGLNDCQLAAVLTVYCSTNNMNLAYIFGKAIDEDNEGLITDVMNIYDGMPSSKLDGDFIQELFDTFSVFYQCRD